MNVVLFYEYRSWSGIPYRVELIDAETPDTEPTYEVAGVGAELNYEGDEQLYPYTPFLHSKLDAYFEIRDDAIENAVLDGLLSSSNEGRFFLRLYKFDSLEWLGVVLPEQIELPRKPKPYNITISASDGLKRLENKEVPIEAKYSRSITTEIIAILNYTDLEQFYSLQDEFLSIASEYYPSNDQDWIGRDPLLNVRYEDPDAVNIIERKDAVDQWTDLYERLKMLLITFGLRIQFTRGRYYIIQIDAVGDGNWKFHNYTKNTVLDNLNPANIVGGSASTETVTNTKVIDCPVQELEGGTVSYTPVVRKVTTTVNIQNVAIVRTYISDFSVGPQIGSVIPTSGVTDLLIYLPVRFEATLNSGSFPPQFFQVFEITVQIGNQYYNFSNQTWSTTQNSNVFRTQTGALAILGKYYFHFPSPQRLLIENIPAAGGNLFITIKGRLEDFNGNVLSNITTGVVEGTIRGKYHNPNANPSGNNSDVTTDVQLGTNLDSTFTVNLESRKLADVFTYSTPGRLINTRSFGATELWHRFLPSTLSGSLTFLVLSAIFRRQQKPLAQYSLGFMEEDISPINTLRLTPDDVITIIQRGTWNTERGEWDLTLMQVDTYADEVTPTLENGFEKERELTIFDATNKFNKTGFDPVRTQLILGYTSQQVSPTDDVINLFNPITSSVAQAGDKIAITSPNTNITEILTLDDPWDAGVPELNVIPNTLQNTYPPGSYLTLTVETLAARITALEP